MRHCLELLTALEAMTHHDWPLRAQAVGVAVVVASHAIVLPRVQHIRPRPT